MGFYCKVCGKWKDIGVPPFCSFDCQDKFNKEQKMRDFQNTLSSINAAKQTALLERQTEIMEQQLQQAQIAAAQEQAKKEADQLAAYDNVSRKYGFRNFAEASNYIRGIGQNEIVTEEVIKKAAEQKKIQEGYKAAKKEIEKEEKSFLFSIMNEEQKKRNYKISNVSKWFEKEGNQLFWSGLISILFIALGIFLYKHYKRSFLQFGFWTIFFTFAAIGTFVAEKFLILTAKLKMKTIKNIKGEEDFPFYIVSDFQLFADAYYYFGIFAKVLLFIASFFWALKIPRLLYTLDVPISYKLCRNIIILVYIAVLIKIIYSKYISSQKKAIIIDGCCFGNSYKEGYDKKFIKQYRVVKIAHKIIGPFMTGDLSGEYLGGGSFETWRKGGSPKFWWQFTFLPEKTNQEFSEKWSYLTKEGQVMSWEEARARWSKYATQDAYKSKEQEKYHQELRQEYDKIFGPNGDLEKLYELYKQKVIEKIGFFDEKIQKEFDKIISDKKITDPDQKKIRNEVDFKSEKSYYSTRYNYIKFKIVEAYNKYVK